MITKIIKKEVTHQGIGGKRFVVDERVSATLTIDEVMENALQGNPACYNFLMRRFDVNRDFPYKLYYGKVGNLGYVVAEDEFYDDVYENVKNEEVIDIL